MKWLALLALALAAGCGDDSSGPPRFDLSVVIVPDMGIVRDLANNAAAVIEVGAGGGNTFTPATVYVLSGDTVAWRWVTGTHSVVSDSAPPAFADSPVQASGVYTATFPLAGQYPYHCGVHGSMMSGVIIVQ